MKYILVLLLLLAVLIPAASAGTAQLEWSKTLGTCVTAVDSNSAGTLIIAGLGNGSIFAYDNTGNITWANLTNTTATNPAIKKIVCDGSGDCVWISQANQSGYISYNGAVAGTVAATGRNFTDVAISDDGSFYATSELNPPHLAIRYPNGSIYAENTTYGTSTYWTKIGLDPSNTWMVSANQSDSRLYFWQILSWAGWEEFNPLKTGVKNVSQQAIDSYPYRQNISILGAATASKGLIFANVSNVTTLTQINASYYFYNPSVMGKYLYWTLSGNISNDQTGLLNVSRLDGLNYLYVVFRPNFTNYTVYYGNLSLNNSIINQSWTNNNTLITVIYNASTVASWTAPARVTAVNLTMYGGGGAGGSGTWHSGTDKGGSGGRAAALTTYSNVAVIPGTSYPNAIGAGGATSNATGGTTFFNNSADTDALGGAGGPTGGEGSYWGGAGANDYTTYTPYPNGTPGNPSYSQWTCYPNIQYTGGNGGNGYGAGGGGGAAEGDNTYSGCNPRVQGPGTGGAGTSGFLQISYYVNDIPVYYNGSVPNPAYLFAQQPRQAAAALNNTNSTNLVGTILGISVPSNGGLASISTSTIFYQQYLSPAGFGLVYCATSSGGAPFLVAGTPYTVAASNSGAATFEGRGAYGLIYDSSGIARASSLTGNTIRSGDVAMSSGQFAAFGGDEGKLYMLSKEGSPTWYSYFTGSADTQILGVSVAWDGSSVVTGDLGGVLKYYNSNVTIPVIPTPSYVDVNLQIFKDSAVYPGQPVTIFISSNGVSDWSPLTTNNTDGDGQLHYQTQTGNYYKFVVNAVLGTTEGEGSAIWQSNTASTQVQIFCLSPSMPYEWNAVYNQDTHNISVTYQDTENSTVNVSIRDIKTNLVVYSELHTSEAQWNFQYHDTLENGSYQVVAQINRLGFNTRDTRTVLSKDVYGVSIPLDPVLKYIGALFIIMIIGGTFSYQNRTRGAFAIVVISAMFLFFGFLPWSMVSVISIAAMFAIMALLGGAGKS